MLFGEWKRLPVAFWNRKPDFSFSCYMFMYLAGLRPRRRNLLEGKSTAPTYCQPINATAAYGQEHTLWVTTGGRSTGSGQWTKLQRRRSWHCRSHASLNFAKAAFRLEYRFWVMWLHLGWVYLYFRAEWILKLPIRNGRLVRVLPLVMFQNSCFLIPQGVVLCELWGGLSTYTTLNKHS